MAKRKAKKRVSKKEDKKCCLMGSMIIAKLVLIAGVYILSWGLIGSGAPEDVLSSPVFWGIILIMMGFCIREAIKMKHIHEMCKI